MLTHICDSGMTPACRGFVLVVSILCPEITCTCMPMLLVQVGCTKHVYDDSSSASFQLKNASQLQNCFVSVSVCRHRWDIQNYSDL